MATRVWMYGVYDIYKELVVDITVSLPLVPVAPVVPGFLLVQGLHSSLLGPDPLRHPSLLASPFLLCLPTLQAVLELQAHPACVKHVSDSEKMVANI